VDALHRHVNLSSEFSGYNVVTIESDCRRGFGLDIGFIDDFNTQHVITLNYIVIANFHILQFTIAHANTFSACSVLTSCCLVTAPTMAIPLFRAQVRSEPRLPSN
jgi:hypothetical protein